MFPAETHSHTATNSVPLKFNNYWSKKNLSAQKSTLQRPNYSCHNINRRVILVAKGSKSWRRWASICCYLVLAVFNITSSNLLKYFHLLHDYQGRLNPKCHSAEAPSWVSTLFLWLQMGKRKNWGFVHSHKDQMMPSVCLCLHGKTC